MLLIVRYIKEGQSERPRERDNHQAGHDEQAEDIYKLSMSLRVDMDGNQFLISGMI